VTPNDIFQAKILYLLDCDGGQWLWFYPFDEVVDNHD